MIYQAKVTNRQDPDMLGRVKVECQSLLASGKELPMWIGPDLPFLDRSGACFFAIPAVNTIVDLVEWEDGKSMGEFSEAYLENPQYRYRPTTFYTNQQPADIWRENYPDRYGWNSPGGHAFIFDDKAEAITLLHKSGNSWVKFEQDGKVKIKGTEIWIDENADKSLVKGEPLRDMLTSWYTWLLAHTHSGVTPGPGISGTAPPIGSDPATVPGDLLSTKHKVG